MQAPFPPIGWPLHGLPILVQRHLVAHFAVFLRKGLKILQLNWDKLRLVEHSCWLFNVEKANKSWFPQLSLTFDRLQNMLAMVFLLTSLSKLRPERGRLVSRPFSHLSFCLQPRGSETIEANGNSEEPKKTQVAHHTHTHTHARTHTHTHTRALKSSCMYSAAEKPEVGQKKCFNMFHFFNIISFVLWISNEPVLATAQRLLEGRQIGLRLSGTAEAEPKTAQNKLNLQNATCIINEWWVE